MFRTWTIEELAEDAFIKSERVKALEAMNTPVDYEERKRAFIELATARKAANDAEARMLAVIQQNKAPSNDDRTKTPMVA